MSKTIGTKDIKKGTFDRGDWLLWISISIMYLFGIAILSGTIEHYLGTEEIAYGLYIDWSMFFFLFGISMWFLITTFIIARANKRKSKSKNKKNIK
jgi:hypothetical protein